MLEILAPAGNAECAAAAINNGADAIYLGLTSFSARQGAENFDGETFGAVLRRAHLCGKKVYVAMNTLVKADSDEIDNFLKDLLFAWNEGADAIILQDPFLGKIVHEFYPEIILHLSTQAGVCNLEGAKFAKECGFSRVILARETPLAEIEKIAAFMETEVFIQGALCTCFSGQCYFSSFAGGNSGNRGRCKQPCRKLYSYNRRGFEKKTYALSLSDLCVGEDIEKLVRVGVISFKIEGRMRRAEYVAAAVRYYRTILDDTKGADTALSDLKRTYNRGNYTKGLAFGQDKRFLSTSIQGHLGEKVGVVKVINGRFFVESTFKPQQGDAFKVLREGKELGGAFFAKLESRGFTLSSKLRLKNGDNVFVTTDNEVNTRVLSAQYKKTFYLALSFTENKKAIAIWENLRIESENELQSAQRCPLTEEEIRNSFSKTDGLPIEIKITDLTIEGNVFIPKSELNAFRRKVFFEICRFLTKSERALHSLKKALFDKAVEKLCVSRAGRNTKTAVIAEDFYGVEADIAVYKWSDLSNELPQSFIEGNFEKYIYYPAYLTAVDIEKLAAYCKKYDLDGIYAENYGGIVFARENGVNLFAGTGFNLTNEYSLSVLLSCSSLSYYCISKELNDREGGNLIGHRAFVLASGDIKLMDLCYCPFGKTCKGCDKKDEYTLTDENGRTFPVRRYVSAKDECRFEVYNCASLIGTGVNGAGKLLDLTLIKDKEAAISAKEQEEKQKAVYKKYTSGHFKRGVL